MGAKPNKGAKPSLGDPYLSVMVFSSFLYSYQFERKIRFGSYILLLYSQFLARKAVDLDKPHRISKNCLNDFCGDQNDILNVFKNEEDVLCNKCLIQLENKKYHDIVKNINKYIKKHDRINFIKIGKKEEKKIEKVKKEQKKD